MLEPTDDGLEELAELCSLLRGKVGQSGSFRLRVLLDMLLLEVDAERERRAEGSGVGPGETLDKR